jgi:CheY-like chemotaxis protein
VHHIFNEVGDVLRATAGKHLDITYALAASPATVLGDPSQLHQIILNLAINARDAIAESGGIGFATRLEELDASAAARFEGLKPGRYLVLTVSDTGSGIAAEVRGRIFEPFFTTKELGEGTGMGLAMVYGIVQNHGGHIELTTAVGRGTTFEVRLPATLEAARALEPAGVEAQRGSGRILVVDDEEVVRLTVAHLLKTLGYQVAMASDGDEAIRHFRTHHGQIDLVILDFALPRMNGRECFSALKQIDPQVKALLSSGYGLDGELQEALAEGMAGFVQKPYVISQVAEAIRRVLATGS